MGSRAYENTGGAPKGSPGYDEAAVFEPDARRVLPYMLLVSLVGIFMLTGLRRLMIVEWRLPFPSGTATGAMLESFFSEVRGEGGGGVKSGGCWALCLCFDAVSVFVFAREPF